MYTKITSLHLVENIYMFNSELTRIFDCDILFQGNFVGFQ